MMKKIISLVILIGLVAILIPFYISQARAENSAETHSIKPEQVGPPWFDTAWHYRRIMTISNSGDSLSYYQILIALNSSNFNFNLANIDGSDVRFTHSDGTTELEYWIESWDKIDQQAYVWVRVPFLGNGDTIIYLYYNNPAAISLSNGATTFDGFDDNWSQFAGTALNQSQETQIPRFPNVVESPFDWSTINGSPTASSGILSLVPGTGINSTSLYQYLAVGFRANFGSGNGHVDPGHEWIGFLNVNTKKGTMIGDLISDEANLYLVNFDTSENDALLPRNGGIDWHNTYHTYEVRWKSGLSEGEIDHGLSSIASSGQVPSAYLPVTLYNYIGSNTTLLVDWVYLRQYRLPEPTSTVGTEQALMDLGINMVDSPDPLRTGVELSYTLTISNLSSIAAPGVVVTDTLPANVQFVRVDPSSGCTHTGSEVFCSFNTIPAHQSATVMLVVTPANAGVIINSAIVGSPGYDRDMSNNWAEVPTLVDSDPPNVNWESPAHNGGSYVSNGGTVPLIASATDNDQVTWVEFWYWDHLPISEPRGKVSIGTDYSYPYQIQFNSDVLVSNEVYQVFVQAADRAGNISSIYVNPSPVIYFKRISLSNIYLPITIK